MSELYNDYPSLLAYLENCPRKDKIVGLLINNYDISQAEWLNPLAEYLNSKDYITIGILTDKSAGHANLNKTRYTACVNISEIPSLEAISIFVISDMDGNIRYPENSIVVGWMHAFALSPASTALAANIMTLGRLDAFLTPYYINQRSRAKIQALWSELLMPEHSFRKRKNFYLISSGYPRMKLLAEKVRSCANLPDAIVYAPAKEHYRQDLGGNRIREWGITLIENLLHHFPEKNVIFRPYIADINNKSVLDIVDRFFRERRFHFDASPGKEETFSKGCALITDISHIGQTFASATLKPAILFRPWENGATAASRNDTGFIVRTMGSLLTTLQDIMEQPEKFEARNRCARALKSMPFEDAFASLEAIIHNLRVDMPQREWVKIKRFSKPCKSEADTVRDILKIQSGDNLATIFACLLLYNNPKSELFAALTFHFGLLYFPGGTSRPDVLECVGKILGVNVVIDYIGQFPPEYVARLYALAARHFIRKKDLAGVRLVQNLVEEFGNFVETRGLKEKNI